MNRIQSQKTDMIENLRKAVVFEHAEIRKPFDIDFTFLEFFFASRWNEFIGIARDVMKCSPAVIICFNSYGDVCDDDGWLDDVCCET